MIFNFSHVWYISMHPHFRWFYFLHYFSFAQNSVCQEPKMQTFLFGVMDAKTITYIWITYSWRFVRFDSLSQPNSTLPQVWSDMKMGRNPPNTKGTYRLIFGMQPYCDPTWKIWQEKRGPTPPLNRVKVWLLQFQNV